MGCDGPHEIQSSLSFRGYKLPATVLGDAQKAEALDEAARTLTDMVLEDRPTRRHPPRAAGRRRDHSVVIATQKPVRIPYAAYKVLFVAVALLLAVVVALPACTL